MWKRFRETALTLFRSKAEEWTWADQLKALTRGWGLFEHDGAIRRELQLQAADDRLDRFAWRQVQKEAGAGDALAQKALRVLRLNNPDEFRYVTAVADHMRQLED